MTESTLMTSVSWLRNCSARGLLLMLGGIIAAPGYYLSIIARLVSSMKIDAPCQGDSKVLVRRNHLPSSMLSNEVRRRSMRVTTAPFDKLRVLGSIFKRLLNHLGRGT